MGSVVCNIEFVQVAAEQFLWYTHNTHDGDTVDSLLTVRQLLVTVKQSSTMPSTR